MAWNEPGGSGKDKDPWGGGGGGSQGGPPDLDEVVKKMQEKFGSLFGGGGSGRSGGGSGGRGIGSVGIGVILVVIVAIWALMGFYTVDEGKRAVVLQFGKYKETTTPGLQWVAPLIESYEIVNIENVRDARIGYRSETTTGRRGTRPLEEESLMLTQDENIVDIRLAVQYKIKSASDYLFNVVDPDNTLRQAAESALREVIGKNNMDFILTEGRTEIAAKVRLLMQDILDRYKTGLLVTSVNMQDAQPPEQVQDAFDDAVKAREDEERLKNQAEAYANDVLPRARGKAARAKEDSLAYKERVIARAKGETSRFLQVLGEYKKAPEVTRKRLYIDAVESVMEKTSKVLVDVDGSNNLMYLPLDKMIQGSAVGRGLSGSGSSNDSSSSSSSSSSRQPLRDSSRSTTRGGR